MADAVRGLVALYMSGESTYPETLESLNTLMGSRQAHDVLRLAVEGDNEVYLSLLT